MSDGWQIAEGARFYVGRSTRFSASHLLPNVPKAHKCSRLHGHTYHVAIEVSGRVDPTLGWVIDFSHLDVALRTLVFDVLDHRHLNEIEGLENPTAEALCAWCAARLGAHLNGIRGVRLVGVRVEEGNGGGFAALDLVGCAP